MKRFSPFTFLILALIISCHPEDDDLYSVLLPGSESPPEIVATYPEEGMMGANGEEPFWVLFNKEMDQELTETTFTVSGDEGSIVGSYTWVGTQLFFYPQESLTGRDLKTLTISSNAESTEGVDLEDNYIVHFYAKNDITCPTFLSSDPADQEVRQSSPFVVYLYFDEPILASSMNDGITISPDFNYHLSQEKDGSVIKIEAQSALTVGTEYTISLSTELTDLESNPLSDHHNISIYYGEDIDPPEVQKVSIGGIILSEGITKNGIEKDDSLSITFNEPIEPISLESNFSISPSTDINYSWNADNSAVTINFPTSLLSEEIYEITIPANIEDLAGHTKGSDSTYRFFTNGTNSIRPEILEIRQYYSSQVSSPIVGDGQTILSPVSLSSPLTDMSVLEINHYEDIDTTIGSVDKIMWLQVTFNNNLLLGSLLENISITPIIDPIPSTSFEIYDIVSAGNTVIVKIRFEAPVAAGSEVPIYRIKFTGGATGINDTSNNYMTDDFNFYFTFI